MMKAARFHAAGDIRVEDIPIPQPNENEVLIEVEWCGICGSDLHEYLTGPNAIRRPSNPHPLTGVHVPVTMGHEFCGRVVQTSPSSSLKVDQKVMVDPRLLCGSCHQCTHGIDNLCASLGFVGYNAASAGFGEFAAVDAKMCYALPDDVDLAEAALIEPLCVGRHALEIAGVDDWKEKNVLVLGGGPIGIAVLWNLRAMGVKMAVVSEPTKLRREHSRELTDHVLNPMEVNVVGECKQLTGGLGVNVVFDCAGVPAGMVAGMDALRARGTYVNVAAWEKPFVLPTYVALLKELTIKSSLAYNAENFQQVMDDFAEGKLEGVGKMITSRILLQDIVEKGFEELVHHKDQHVKILITPKEALIAR